MPQLNPLPIHHASPEPRDTPLPRQTSAVSEIFSTNEVIELIVCQMNEYAELQRARGGHKEPWHAIKKEELYAYVGVSVYCSINPQRSVGDLWNTSETAPIREP